MTAPAAMPSVEDVALAIKRAQLGGRAELSKGGPWREHEFKPACAILDLFAPILAEKQKPTVALNHWKARALAAEAALAAERERCAKIAEGASASFDYNEAMADCRDYDCGYNAGRQSAAAAIRAQGE